MGPSILYEERKTSKRASVSGSRRQPCKIRNDRQPSKIRNIKGEVIFSSYESLKLEPFNTALFRATSTKTKTLGLRSLWFFCHYFVDGKLEMKLLSISLVSTIHVYPICSSPKTEYPDSPYHWTLSPFWRGKRQRKHPTNLETFWKCVLPSAVARIRSVLPGKFDNFRKWRGWGWGLQGLTRSVKQATLPHFTGWIKLLS